MRDWVRLPLGTVCTLHNRSLLCKLLLVTLQGIPFEWVEMLRLYKTRWVAGNLFAGTA